MTSKSKICIIVKETIAASAAAAAQEQSSVIRGAGQGTSGAGSAAGTASLSPQPWQAVAEQPSLRSRGMGETCQWEMLFLLVTN